MTIIDQHRNQLILSQQYGTNSLLIWYTDKAFLEVSEQIAPRLDGPNLCDVIREATVDPGSWKLKRSNIFVPGLFTFSFVINMNALNFLMHRIIKYSSGLLGIKVLVDSWERRK